MGEFSDSDSEDYIEDQSGAAYDIEECRYQITQYNKEILNFIENGEENVEIDARNFLTTYLLIKRVCDDHNQPNVVLKQYRELLDSYLEDRALQMDLKTSSGAEYLATYNKLFKQFTKLCFFYNKLFDYLDKYHLKKNKEKSLYMRALQTWHQFVFTKEIKNLQTSVFAEIKKERKNEVVDRDAIKTAISQFQLFDAYEYDRASCTVVNRQNGTLQWKTNRDSNVWDTRTYQEKFGRRLLKETSEFYEHKVQEWQETMDCDQYIQTLDQYFSKEDTNCDEFYPLAAKGDLIKVLTDTVLVKQAQNLTLMDTGCKYMFEQGKNDQLKTMFEVFNRVPGCADHISAQMSNHVTLEGTKLLSNADNLKDPIKFTTELLAFKKKIDDTINFSFQNDMAFQKARDQSFMLFMNGCNLTPHYICVYFDAQLKSGFKQMPICEIEEKIDAVIRLFCCLSGRDVFIAAYSKLLAVRLLNKTTVSDEIEKMMINKLQVECGHNTTHKIKVMFEDIQKSRTMMAEFKSRPNGAGTNSVNGIEFAAEILTSGHWPYQQLPKCVIPEKLLGVRNTFDQFYRAKFQNRQINYVLNVGSVMVQTTYLAKHYQFQLSFYQAAIVILFNSEDVLTYQEIQNKLEISDEAMKESMMKLCNPKTGIMKKQNAKVPKFLPTEKIQLNEKYASPNIRCSFVPNKTALQMAQSGETQSGIDQLDQQVKQERAMIIDASLVRIMKARKVHTHQNLIEDLISQIKLFKAQPIDIKKRIESLIERDYLERDGKDRARYIYKP